MAQDFYRYPLVDGQGNWAPGSGPCRDALHGSASLRRRGAARGARQGTVDWTPNFDGTLDEPKVLPGASGGPAERSMGIAVGTARISLRTTCARSRLPRSVC